MRKEVKAMKKINFKKSDILSLAVGLGTLVLGLAKLKVDANNKEAEKAEIVEEVVAKLSNKED